MKKIIQKTIIIFQPERAKQVRKIIAKIFQSKRLIGKKTEQKKDYNNDNILLRAIKASEDNFW